jgi:histone-lysine N-methyltransferase SETMAR
MSHGSAYSIVHNDLGYRKVCIRWVPRQLSDENKRERQTICQEHLDSHAREGDAFLHRIWQETSPGCTIMNHRVKDNPCSGSTRRLRPTQKFKTQPSAGKVVLTVFCDVNGPILVHFQEKGQTVASARYSDMLANELKPAIRSKRRGLLSKGVLLLHDNGRLHTAAHTVDTLRTLKFEVLKHPPYVPDLAPSDFHLFGPMKEHLRGQNFKLCRWRGNGDGEKLVKGHARKLF